MEWVRFITGSVGARRGVCNVWWLRGADRGWMVSSAGLGVGCVRVCVLYVVPEPLGVGILGGRFHGGVLIAKVQNKLSCLCLYIPKKREKNGSKSSQATCQISAVEVNHHCRACPRGGGEGKGEGES